MESNHGTATVLLYVNVQLIASVTEVTFDLGGWFSDAFRFMIDLNAIHWDPVDHEVWNYQGLSVENIFDVSLSFEKNCVVLRCVHLSGNLISTTCCLGDSLYLGDICGQ